MRNLQECILLFSENEMMMPAAVRMMESLSEWGVAAEYWGKMGRKEDQDACLLIKKAIEIGDSYREEVKHIMDWVEKSVDENLMSRDEALKLAQPKIQEIYNKHYKV